MNDEPRTVAAAPATPRPAATVILLRRTADDRSETFMVRRDPRSRFAANAYVFPGGTVLPEELAGDHAGPDLTAAEAHRRFSERGGDAPESAVLSLALYRSAVRELFEEAGVLLARRRGEQDAGAPGPDAVAAVLALRGDLQQGRRAFDEVLRAAGLEPTADRLVYFSHWITPEASPRRYDTRFFVVELPEGQEPTHCGVETVDGEWLAPREALDRFERGEIVLVDVTAAHLRLLDELGGVDAILRFGRAKPIRTIRPHRRDGAWSIGEGAW